MAAPIVLVVGRISPKADGLRTPAYAIGQKYLQAIRRAGGMPLMLPPDPDLVDDVAALLGRVDAVVLAGGGDVDPRRYGVTNTADELYGVVLEHDTVEFAVTDAALARQVPIFAVCRGMQVLNVAMGGTLHQHIGDDHWFVHHDVHVEAGSRLAKAVGDERIGECHSVHHQAVDRVADGLRITGRAADGTIEAYEHDGPTWMVGVQWHPEDNAPDVEWQQALYDDLVRHA